MITYEQEERSYRPGGPGAPQTADIGPTSATQCIQDVLITFLALGLLPAVFVLVFAVSLVLRPLLLPL